MFLKQLGRGAARYDWFGAVVEVGIVVVGVFLGIQASNWNQGRLNRAEGRDYRDQLVRDLDSNQRDIAFRVHYDGQILRHAESALAALDLPVSDNPGAFIIDAYEASNHIPQSVRRSTYDEVQASGKAGFLGDQQLRDQIANYYVGMATMQRLFDNVPTYRTRIRSTLPFSVQQQVLKDCPEVLVTDQFGSVTPKLADKCVSSMDPQEALRIAQDVRNVPNLRWELNAVMSDLNQKILNAQKLSLEAKRLKAEIEAAN